MIPWDNGRGVVLAGSAAGIVAPAFGEGIYHAMVGERLVAEAVEAMCTMVSVRSPEPVWKRFISNHGHVFFVLGIARHFWYLFDKRREGFVKMCNDKNVQRRVRGAYMNKIVRTDRLAHVRILVNYTVHLRGFARV